MSSSLPSAIPPGWYPDPSGARQWRVWTGDRWSDLTRSFGTAPVARDLIASLPLIQALHRVRRYGVTGFYAGLGLVVGILAHWPGTAHPATARFATTTLDAGIVLLVLGLAHFVFAAKELAGHWSPWAVVPGLNVLAVSGWVTQRLGGQPVRRVVAEVVLMVLFIVRFRYEPWLAIGPALLAIGLGKSTEVLLDQLAGPSPSPSVAP